MSVANHAAVRVPRTHLLGILDQIKTAALDLALALEGADPAAGSTGGPTVDTEPSLRDTVRTHLTVIYASNSSIAVASGEGATAFQLQAGDVAGLLAAARSLIDEEAVTALSAALEADQGKPGKQTRSLLDRVRDGAVGLGAGLTTNAAYDGLVSLLKMVFPGATH